ncbi:MAG: TIGR01548 family HAD-type hydrolase [Spirulinaceae cyanobacterium SM2_1_0]|nr:TIGR01548 family HAD-type hydrolase [Spirulinaceae cyanobacterium SM2_1_0]
MLVIFDIDGVVRDVGGSYRRAIADTVAAFTQGAYRPSMADIDQLKSEGIWNNDWEGSRELIYRYFEGQGRAREAIALDYTELIDFFQAQYRGRNWDGYVAHEPLLLDTDYLQALSQARIAWGFFSGAPRASAEYVLIKRLGLVAPVLVAMEDAPGKPEPSGLFLAVEQLEASQALKPGQPVVYAGDTVADMQTIVKARAAQPQRTWLGVGILPPHVLVDEQRAARYAEQLRQAGAEQVLSGITELTPALLPTLLA